MQHDRSDHRQGLLYAFLAYASWGLLPIYFRMVSSVGPIEVLAHRVLWSCLLIIVILVVRGEWSRFVETLRDGRTLAALSVGGILIGLNWLTYVWAVMNGHIVATSLAYFLNPLVNVLLGIGFLGERLRAVQWLAIALAAAGVAILGAGAPQMLGISLLLAGTFAIYGFIRKVIPVSPLIGLGVETVALLAPAVTGIAWSATHRNGLGFGNDVGTSILLAGSGLITSIPLLLFASAARILPLVTMGLIQYVTPTLLFAIGVLLYGETLSAAQWATFALIWTGLAIFASDALRRGRRSGNMVAEAA